MARRREAVVGFLVVLAGASMPARARDAPAALDPKGQFEVLFGDQVKRVAATEIGKDDAELAGKILITAATIKTRPKLRIVMYEKAYGLALKHHAGYATAEQAARLLQKADSDRGAQCREMLLGVCRKIYAQGKARRKYEAGARLVEQLILVADDKADASKWTEANSLLRQALGMATALRMSAARRRVMEKIREVSAAQKAQLRIAYLESRLKKDPSDAKSRTELIRLYVVDLDRPSAAAGLITEDVEEALRTYVPLAAKDVADVAPAACLELGAWYRQLAGNATEKAKVTTLTRAKACYDRYLASGEGEPAARLGARLALDRVGKDLAKLTGTELGPPLPGAVLVLTFNEGTFFEKGGQAYARDLSEKSNHGLVVSAKRIKGVAGGGLYFDGSSAYVALGNPPSLQTRDSQTISMWLWPQSLGARRNPWNKSFGGEGTMTLERGGDINYWYGTGGNNTEPYMGFNTSKALTTKGWTHVVLVRDLGKKTLTWYCNGAVANRVTAKYSRAAASTLNAYIGKGYVSNFIGKIDEVAVFARALSSSEVKKLYLSGREGKSLR